MANIENVKLAIQVMERATNLDMRSWQADSRNAYLAPPIMALSIDDLHACGNTACFAGYLAISGIPGWSISAFQKPKYKEHLNESAVKNFLEISNDLAYALVYGEYTIGDWDTFYPVPFSKITPDHVIEKLNLILTGELQ
ncbi:p51 [Pseudomonas phage PaP2]|uniref:hypothetical protein n=1 Tax=Pseudomonas phage PaP2 TaxID=270673 RepID=UPI00003593E7|nr:hypothetical protein PaP2_gp51 [Pseudomonas phage PaP2]AAS89637.1 p51 [Pseudomonas phage PaP2]ANA49065.1 hypothetical protein PaMx43_ORF47 [Pseudomonas phage PaMx43]